MMKKYIKIVALSCGALFLSACGGDTDSSGILKDIKEINVTDPDNNATMLATDTSRSLTSYVIYNDGSSALATTNVTWESNETNVSANYNSIKGDLGLSSNYDGNVTITVSSQQFSDTYTMNIDGITQISMNPSTYDNSIAGAGASFNIQASAIYTSGADSNITSSATWSTTNSSIATVDTNGVVSVLTSGDFNVSATLLGESNTTIVSNP